MNDFMLLVAVHLKGATVTVFNNRSFPRIQIGFKGGLDNPFQVT